jgi:NitT/TauT family transport system substrate-binding protein
MEVRMPQRLSRKESIALGVAFASWPRFVAAQAATAVAIGVNSNESNAEAFYAKDSGIFARNGLDVDVNVLNGGAAVASAITGGTLQIGASNVLSLATAIAKGLPFVAIAPAAIHDTAHPTSGILVAPQGPIHNARDLNGKIISGISIGGLDQLAALAWVDKFGGDSSTVKYIELPPPAVPIALEQNRISAGLVGEPLLSDQMATGLRLLGHGYDGIAPHFEIVAWFAKRDWVAANPDVVRAFSASLAQGGAWAAANPEPGMASLSKWTKTKVTKLRMEVAKTLDPALLRPLLDSAYKYKFLPRPVPPSDLIWNGR